ncbi:MAG: YitT family protein [Erysipelotrichaceae bacterium]|nr:YitT family protein [Erysipelotrichaceae bacterium]
MTKNKYIDIKLLLIAVISALVQSFAITSFSIPASLYPAGFSGISRITTDILKDYGNILISYSVFYLSINILATLFFFKRIGKKFAVYSVIQFTLVACFTSFFKPLLSIDERLLMAIFGGILNGFGVGLALSSNFSTGGIDFISVYFANRYKKDIWNYIFIVNVVILAIAGLVYGFETALYSIIYQYTSTNMIKMLHQRYTHKTLTIITSDPERVSEEILKHVRHGITEVNATGYYSHENKTMLYTVVNSFQYKEVVKIVLQIDPHAFINVQDTEAIYGNYYQKPLD